MLITFPSSFSSLFFCLPILSQWLAVYHAGTYSKYGSNLSRWSKQSNDWIWFNGTMVSMPCGFYDSIFYEYRHIRWCLDDECDVPECVKDGFSFWMYWYRLTIVCLLLLMPVSFYFLSPLMLLSLSFKSMIVSFNWFFFLNTHVLLFAEFNSNFSFSDSPWRILNGPPFQWQLWSIVVNSIGFLSSLCQVRCKFCWVFVSLLCVSRCPSMLFAG